MRRLTFWKSWVWIPVLFITWPFFHRFVVKKLMFVLKYRKQAKRGIKSKFNNKSCQLDTFGAFLTCIYLTINSYPEWWLRPENLRQSLPPRCWSWWRHAGTVNRLILPGSSRWRCRHARHTCLHRGRGSADKGTEPRLWIATVWSNIDILLPIQIVVHSEVVNLANVTCTIVILGKSLIWNVSLDQCEQKKIAKCL